MIDLTCASCHSIYKTVLGVPFIGEYEAADALGLIEIAANASHRDVLPLASGTVERLEALCAAYHVAQDKSEFINANPEAGSWYFPNRYSEWLSFNLLIEAVELEGRRVLDIGAGIGFDSQRLALRGAEITALEFSPILAEAGHKGVPHIRWIGGFSHVLPFKSASFDAVFFNAALHHMRDIPACISEALRVLRPGGTLVTTGDPFRADQQSASLEFDVFDRHSAVLLGINEQIPRFSDFVQTFEQNSDFVDVDIFTRELHNHAAGSKIPDLTRWDIVRDRGALCQCSGSIAMRAKLLKPWTQERKKQTAGILSPAVFAEWLTDQSVAITCLAAIIPAEYVDLPFPGSQTKFSLLNGWRLPSRASDTRTAYRRARWFLTRQGAHKLTFSIRSPENSKFTILVNNKAAVQLNVMDAWTPIALDLSHLDPAATFVVEIRRDEPEADFDKACFQIRSRKLHRQNVSLFTHVVSMFGGASV